MKQLELRKINFDFKTNFFFWSKILKPTLSTCQSTSNRIGLDYGCQVEKHFKKLIGIGNINIKNNN